MVVKCLAHGFTFDDIDERCPQCSRETRDFPPERKLATIRHIMWHRIQGVVERDDAWEELGLSYAECLKLYDLLHPGAEFEAA